MSTLYANLLRSWATWIEHLSVGVAIAVTSQGLVQLAAIAQITPDDSLGATPSVVVPEAPNQTLIRGGAQSGANLFHSFQDFNVGLDQQVYFANPAAIENILTRVTGSEASDILGTLGVLGNANLFLLNPNGILFGPDAQLDISGSFTASTAEGFEWANGASFSAVNPTAPPLLTVSLTPGLRYSSSGQVADITQAGTLTAGQNLMLSAGNLDLQGQLQAGQDLTLTALETLQVRDSVGEPFGAIAAQDLLIEGNQVDIFALNHTDSGFWSGGDMVLRSPHPISGDAHYQSGGLFQIEDFAGNLGALVSPNDPVIRAAGDVSFESYEGASLHILAGGSVTIPGDIIITGPDTVANSLQETVTLSNGDVLAIEGSVTPTLDIRAGTLAAQETSITGDVDGFTPFPDINDNGDNAAIILGDISNPGGIVFLSNQHEPDPALSGDVSIGVIDLLKPEGGGSVVVDSRGVINSNQPINVSGIDPTNLSSTGNAGDIVMLATNEITLGAET
ncbi:MAG: filamentous hemagglutinin N-terminal domain-containing protein, partial [Cyanobacteria bacterium P01_F01_bin.86]